MELLSLDDSTLTRLPTTNANSPSRAVHLGTAPSLLLDLIRLSAAVVVVVGHLSQSRFSSGWPDLTVYAVNAVTAFFLLSGFVIRYVTVRRHATLPHYLVDRASRIDSVLLPALVLSLLVDLLLARGVQLRHLLAAVLANLTFTAFSWHHSVSFLSNSAMWSLSFECFYYVLYGVFFYRTGWPRALFLVLAAMLAGPEILTLLPVWLAGCLLFELYLYVRDRRWFLPSLAMVLTFVAASIAAVPSLRTSLRTLRLAAMRTTHRLESSSAAPHSPLAYLLPHIGHGSRVSFNAYGWGVILFILMLLALLIADRVPARDDGRPARLIRLLAESTYPLYLVHLPLLFLVVAALGHPIRSNPARLAILLALLGLSVWLGVVCNRFKLQLRHWLLKLTS